MNHTEIVLSTNPFRRTLPWLASALALAAASAVVACGEDTDAAQPRGTGGSAGGDGGGGAAGGGTIDSFPYTPAGCSYTVAPPDVAESAGNADTFGADATPRYLHSSWPGATHTGFAVNWVTDLDTLATQLLIGTERTAVEGADAASTGVTLQYGHTMLYGSVLFADAKQRAHEVHVCGLAADTTYYYKVGGPGHWSQTYEFSTAPAPGTAAPFKFAVLGDSRSGPEIYAQIQKAAFDQGVDFQLFSGDFVDNTQNQSQWEALFGGASSGFAVQDALAQRPMMPANGNHDNLSAYYNGLMALPQDVSQGESAQGEEWYSFDYSNAHFVVVNSESPSATLTTQREWMRTDLAKVDRAKTPWIFVAFHTPTYSCASTHEGDQLPIRAAWQPVFDEFEVDFVLMGHVHNYQRTLPIRGFQAGGTEGQVAATGANDVPVIDGSGKSSGTLYILSAGAGGDLYGVKPSSACYFASKTEETNNWGLFSLDGKQVAFTAYKLDGTVLDELTFTK